MDSHKVYLTAKQKKPKTLTLSLSCVLSTKQSCTNAQLLPPDSEAITTPSKHNGQKSQSASHHQSISLWLPANDPRCAPRAEF